jgi:hypothetical protein
MSLTFTAANATEALILEQALAYARQLTRLAESAPDGQVLRVAEACVLDQGRELLRQSLRITLQAQAEAVEKKRLPSAPAPADSAGRTKESRPNNC